MTSIIGRKREIAVLEKVISSDNAEFVALYGRRRVGKTYLIEQFFKCADIYMECAGIKDGTKKEQLTNFMGAFQDTFYPDLSLNIPRTWREAFSLLTTEVKKISDKKSIVVFLDELPWLASKKSALIQNLDYFWNKYWRKIPNFKLIVCGSAASWMLQKLINAKGGLHNRLTKTILLEPFTLGETKEFLGALGLRLNERQVLDIYMVVGGIPFYLTQIQRSKSISQNINDLCFTKDGLLYSEFPRLFQSLFNASALNLRIIREISKYPYRISFHDLLKKTGKKAGGRFRERLSELEAAGFIKKFIPYGKKKRDTYYKVLDEYTLFYLRWIEDIVDRQSVPKDSNYWAKISKSNSWQSWAGYAFEGICYKHANKIIDKLGLDSITCLVGNWRFVPNAGEKGSGAQIDLLLDRDDDAITLCEIKYSTSQLIIDKTYAKNLLNKVDVFKNYFNTTKQIFLCMVTTMGAKDNIWFNELVDGEVVLSDFF